MTSHQIATLGAGCFWCIEAVYLELQGVEKVVSGYTGGQIVNPTYQQICTGTTGHAEVAQISFDPAVLSFADLLQVFWHVHDPTTLNRQGGDVGTQYRSVIFYHDEEQRAIAEQSKADTDSSDLWTNPIVTEISPLDIFYLAEDYHQNYFAQNPFQPYCQMVVAPKVQKFRKIFANRLKS
ncbi:peptide-methionine (S)-S-oxide reductase MsrA [Anaerolineales bacterium HSG25]|nr:peptide-methionine (S)-S-oxide reductase MsrA [Anaerolineales bacterium HSG25]